MDAAKFCILFLWGGFVFSFRQRRLVQDAIVEVLVDAVYTRSCQFVML